MSARAALYAAAHGALVLDATRRLTSCTTATGMRGFVESQLTLQDSNLDEQLRIAAQSSMAVLTVGEGQGADYSGRLEDVPIGGSQLQLRAFGAARAMDDIPYTAMWSDTQTGVWRPIQDSERGDALPDRFQFNTTNRLYMAPIKNSSLSSTTCAFLLYQTPDRGSKDIIGIDFSFDMTLASASWRLQLIPLTTGFSAGAAIFTLAGTGANQTGARHLTFTATPWIAFQLQFNAAAAVFAGETGSTFVEIANLRLVTSTTNRVNTTLTANRAAGAGVTATVGSTTGMYVGQKLVVRDVGSAAGEVVTVTSITSSTQFVATFVGSYLTTATVQAQQVYPDEIVSHCVSQVNAVNTNTQMVAPTNRIQTGDIDCYTEVFEDARMSGVLDAMVSYGDTNKNHWNWWVDRERCLVFERRGLNGYTFYVDVSPDQLDIIRSTADMIDSAYATYQEGSGRTLRTTTTTDAPAVARYGLTRRAAVPAQTTSSVQAGLIRDTFLQDSKTPQPKIRITVDRLYDAGGNDVPLSAPNAGRGDTIVIRNLSPILPGDASQLRSFRLGYSSYDWLAGTLTLESENPPEGLVVPVAAFAEHLFRPAAVQSTPTGLHQSLGKRGARLPGRGDTLDDTTY